MWRWSFKRASYEQLGKFSAANIEYYGTFLLAIQEIPYAKLKFADEGHFRSKGKYFTETYPFIDLLRQLVLSPINEPKKLPTSADLDTTYSVTVLTTLNPFAPHPVILDLREDSNAAIDFLNILTFWIEQKHLIEGDILVVDNASVHVAEEIQEALLQLCQAAGVSLRLLPTYSPELNPCELVFGLMKTHLRYWRGSSRFWLEILNAASVVTYEQMLSFYKYCLVPK